MGCRAWLYLLDEPEAALSVTGNLALLRRMRELVEEQSQFVATHSPILMGYPDAWIYQLGEDGFERVEYQDTDHYRLTRSFLENPEQFLRHFLGSEPRRVAAAGGSGPSASR